ncbi:MAG: cysteine--tRNA ligase [Streptococcaceae bacterium]|nr:cysteine--tRNA ligase [Streptococcaceae bacterium]MCL2858674.1 cysteine--tRNA ligase [Streptococcaceae bacterium]
MLKIYNTLNAQIEEFKPITEGQINMYVCGPTVYNYIHIGNARSSVAFDVIRRYMEYCGYKVNYISNFTDIDDKIIRAAAENKMTPKELADKFIEAFREDTQALGIKSATKNPRVMDYMEQIIEFVQILMDKGYAYESQGDIYFRVDKAKNYGKLANKTLEDLQVGASGRVDNESQLKENPLDFALWKSTDNVAEGTWWSSPWGNGRPGWHIECSVMATEILGNIIDIHGGGADLEFPHHTNEIAQSEAKTGQKFANYWMHNGFVNVDGEKMSKSLGNFKTVHEMLEVVNPQVLRFFLATTHYRRPINFTPEALQDAENNVEKIKNAWRNLSENQANLSDLENFKSDFIQAMNEDFNIANGLTVFYDFLSWVNQGNGGVEVKQFFQDVLTILGLTFEEEVSLDADIEVLIQERQMARANKDFARSDEIRDQLKAQGIILEDTPQGVRWHRE